MNAIADASSVDALPPPDMLAMRAGFRAISTNAGGRLPVMCWSLHHAVYLYFVASVLWIAALRYTPSIFS